jgi:hypothetical protein
MTAGHTSRFAVTGGATFLNKLIFGDPMPV